MKWLQQRKIVITGEGYYAPPTLLMEEGTERRRHCHKGTAIKHPVLDRVKPSFVIFDIRATRQNARMSKITNGSLTRSNTGCFITVEP